MRKEDLYFILYKPAVPGNIGASARAIKTMGFSKLRLIEPADHLSTEARMLAHGSNEILENATVFDTVEKAVEDLDFVIATTAKHRSAKVDYVTSRDLRAFLENKGSLVRKAGILFGTEESGLPNHIILRSDIAATIPMSGSYPSLNLSQSVMVLAYELSNLSPAREKQLGDEKIPGWAEIRERSETILSAAGIPPGSPLYHRILERMAHLKAGDARLLHSVTSRLTGEMKK